MKVLIGYDGSDYSKRALDQAIKFVKALDDSITVLNVFEPMDTEAKGLEILQEVENAKLKNAEIKYDLKTEGNEEIAYTLCKIAEDETYDLLAIGRRGLGRLHTWLYGSVADKVFSAATCPVLIVP